MMKIKINYGKKLSYSKNKLLRICNKSKNSYSFGLHWSNSPSTLKNSHKWLTSSSQWKKSNLNCKVLVFILKVLIRQNRQKSSTNWFRNKLNLSCLWMSYLLRIFSNQRFKRREDDWNNKKNYIKWTNKHIRINFKNCLKNKVNKLLLFLPKSKSLKNRNLKYNSLIKLYLLYPILNYLSIKSLKMISKILGKNLGVL